jgi:hypothetical protein
MQFMAIGALAMKNCSPVAAVQQPLADTASTLVANILHNNFL